MPRWFSLMALVCAALTPGCACSHTIAPVDAGADATFPVGDTGVELGLGGDQGADDGLVDLGADDQGVDAGPGDLSVDAGACATGCVSTDPCMPSDCNPTTGMCEVFLLPDGAPCGDGETDTFICVASECVMRGCGDGLREPGTELWPREGCDDGNDVDGDTCSMACAPTEFVAQVDPGPEEFDITFAPYGQMLVVDGLGNGLLVWVQHHFGIGESREELRASRIDPQGNFLDVAAPLMLDATTVSGFDITPSAVGLSTGGFVVAWTASRLVSGVPEYVILMRRIAPDGTVATEQRVHPAMDGSQRWPRLAALTDSFVIVWQDSGVDPDIWGRRFRNSGAAITTVMALASSTTGRQLKPSVAAQGNAWMVTFLSQAGNISSPMQLRGRRFLDSGPLGNDFSILPDHAFTQQVTALGDDYLVVYTTREFDNQGDLYSMTLPRDAGALGTQLPLDSTPMEGVAHPHVAPYGPREQGGYLVVYHDNEVSPNPRFVAVNITPPSEVDTLRMVMRGEDWPAVAPASYALTGGSVWLAYTAQVMASRVGAVVFQLPPP
jgi:cysteine-rich repeat protein